MDKTTDKYRFDLVLDGELVENSADAFDVANTIIALTTATREMVRIKYGDDVVQQVSINVNAFKEGSLKTQFLLLLNEPIVQQATLPVLAGSYSAYKYGKDAVDMVKDYISVRKWLKGKKPEKIVASPGGDTYNIHMNNSVLTINKDSFKALQDKTVQRNMDKIVDPLIKEGSLLDTLSINETNGSDKQLIAINKSEAKYIKRGDDEFQTIDNLRLKGVITKIDTKVRSGYINLGNMGSRRVSFTYPKALPQEQFDILVLSLRTQVQIYLMGVVNMDMESKPQHVDIVTVEDDEKLL
jgi:hypothetical protein